jgi:FAD/FMN-containing dehydrogenase
MKGLEYHKDSFKPKDCKKSIEVNAITAKAGNQMVDLYEFAAQHGEVAVGGGCATVGVGGFLTGGGHSILAPRYGLASDQVLEIDMVTPSGDFITANECQNEDLFWAMRGVSASPTFHGTGH